MSIFYLTSKEFDRSISTASHFACKCTQMEVWSSASCGSSLRDIMSQSERTTLSLMPPAKNLKHFFFSPDISSPTRRKSRTKRFSIPRSRLKEAGLQPPTAAAPLLVQEPAEASKGVVQVKGYGSLKASKGVVPVKGYGSLTQTHVRFRSATFSKN